MNLQDRILLLAKLGDYVNQNPDPYQLAKENANRANPWFIPEFIEAASVAIARNFLDREKLQNWVKDYNIPEHPASVKTVGIVMAGNIPLVGFHDLLCVFVSGHRALVKPSSKDDVLIRHLVDKLAEWEPAVTEMIGFAEKLSGCDAYIATGSNNTGRYFEYYFGKYPNIIRYNRTSVAVLDGSETGAELDQLADDICLYFGLGCRNVTKIFVPGGYDFIPLLEAMKKYDYFLDYHKYKHNFDYHLALLMMSKKFYMTAGTTIFTENASPFTPVSQVHYEFYSDKQELLDRIQGDPAIQALVGHGLLPFGRAQQPRLNDYADGTDIMAFLLSL